MSKISEQNNIYAKKLMKAFSQFRKIHWRPSHVQDLKPSEFRLLHTVKHSYMDGTDGLMVSEISDMLMVARPTVTQLVNGLQKKGYLEKHSDEKDKRVVRISLSNSGKAQAKKGAEEFYCRFESLAEHLGDKKSNELADLLIDVFDYFNQTNH